MMNERKVIYTAFLAAQKEFGKAIKTSANPFFKSKYADLTACIDAVLAALHGNGFALMQLTHECESGVKVETKFLHESGGEISAGIIQVPTIKKDPQAYGSAVTYARRYSLLAACGIAPEDDDGNSATHEAKPRHEPAKARDKYAESLQNASSVDDLQKVYQLIPTDLQGSYNALTNECKLRLAA